MNTDDHTQAVPRCPRCLAHDQVERSGGNPRGWWCTGCRLVFAGTAGEHASEARRRATEETARTQWARRRDTR